MSGSGVYCDFGECVEMPGGKLICDLLPDCGCVGSVMRLTYFRTLEALAVDTLQGEARVDWDALRGSLGWTVDERLFYAVMLLLDDRDLIEHGTSIRVPWITNKGREALALMRDHWKPLLDPQEPSC